MFAAQDHRPLTTIVDRFAHNRHAGVAIMFGLALIPLAGAVGAAVDYGRASRFSSSMQSAVDGTALALSKDAATMSNSELQAKATQTFANIFNKPAVKNVAVSASFTQTPTTQVTVSASGTVTLDFMRMFGQQTMRIASSSKATWGNVKLRAALVLDTTGSMDDDGKIDALKTSAKNLLTQLQGAASQDGDVYVSIVPFSKNVNAGSSNFGASWLDWTDWEAEPKIMAAWLASNQATWEQTGPGDDCPFSTSAHGFKCAPNPTSLSTVSSIPSSGTYKGLICPSTDGGQKDSTRIGIIYNGCYDSAANSRNISTGSSASCGSKSDCACTGSGSGRVCKQTYYTHSWIKNARSTWTGCIADRGGSTAPSGDYDRLTTAPSTGITASLFPAEQNAYCSPAMRSLSYDWMGMKAAIDGLYPLGATNQPIGLASGWLSLVGGGPFPAPPAKDARYQYNEVIILMSDGLNTLNRWSGNGSSVSTAVDRRMYDTNTTGTCANVKAANVTIYTIQVNTNGDPESSLLKSCASSTSKFWMVTSSGALNDVFQQIGTELSAVRIFY